MLKDNNIQMFLNAFGTTSELVSFSRKLKSTFKMFLLGLRRIQDLCSVSFWREKKHERNTITDKSECFLGAAFHG